MNTTETTNDSALTIDVTSAAIGDWRELACREGDGLEICLLWSKSTGRVKVTVADSKLDEEFVLDVAGADALAAFNHPFAYEPSRSLCSVETDREPLNLHPQA